MIIIKLIDCNNKNNANQFLLQVSQHQCDGGTGEAARFAGARCFYSNTLGAYTCCTIQPGYSHLCIPHPSVHCLALLYIWWVVVFSSMSCPKALHWKVYYQYILISFVYEQRLSWYNSLTVDLYFQASLHARSAFKASALPSPSTWPSLCPFRCSSQLVGSGLTMLVPSMSYLPTSSGNARMVTSSMNFSTMM